MDLFIKVHLWLSPKDPGFLGTFGFKKQVPGSGLQAVRCIQSQRSMKELL
jgi:hypothetical protein